MRLSSQMPRALLAASALLALAANCSVENQKSADYLEGEEPIGILEGLHNPRPTDAEMNA